MDYASPLIIPIFLHHLGCPHRCIFCNQVPITGTSPRTEPPPKEAVTAEINTWLERFSSAHPLRKVQVAFYGGSFTGLPLERQIQYLKAVQPFIKSGQINEIRLSTRPDYISSSTPKFLRDFGVTIIELGVQSMSQKVLDQSLRGHSVTQIEQAITTLKRAGISTGAQVMLGLPGETTVTTMAGVKRLAQLQPDFVRIYPTLVIKGSGLERVYHNGGYIPLSLNKAVALTTRITHIFAKNRINIIRTGLQPNAELEANLIAGPYHPAFGELVKSRLLFKKARHQLRTHQGFPCKVIVALQDRSLLTGNKQKNLLRLKRLGLLDHATIIFTESGVRGEVLVEDIA